MKMKVFVLAVIISFISRDVTFAHRQLEKDEILQILQELTSQPRNTWIPSGTIAARHKEYRAPQATDPIEIETQINEECQAYKNLPDKRELTEKLQRMKYTAIPSNVRYKLSNEHTMVSDVIVKYDGERFYWEIEVESRTDSIKPVGGNYMTDRFNLNWNARRVFAWDGEKYTTYFRPGNHAMVTEELDNIPIAVNGPLTAGVIPWGYGIYKYDDLATSDYSALENDTDGTKEIHLNVSYPDMDMAFILDPAKSYAVLSYTRTGPGDAVITHDYDNYQLVTDTWIPYSVTIEQYDNSMIPARFIGYDIWDITSIETTVPEPESFLVKFETDTLIEHSSPVINKPLKYRYSEAVATTDGVDTDSLLIERLIIASIPEEQAHNCATAAMKYVASQFGRDITDQELASLVNTSDMSTNLYELHQFSLLSGFYSLAVQTDIQTLNSIRNCLVILHLPARNHYVVLGNIDNKYIRLIDMDRNNFFYREKPDRFKSIWNEGTALLIATEPIELEGTFVEIDDSRLRNIIGGDDCEFGCYSCTELIQEYGTDFCWEPIGGLCGGTYTTFHERYGCELMGSGTGNCYGTGMIGRQVTPCINNPEDPFVCIGTGNWTLYYMRACD